MQLRYLHGILSAVILLLLLGCTQPKAIEDPMESQYNKVGDTLLSDVRAAVTKDIIKCYVPYSEEERQGALNSLRVYMTDSFYAKYAESVKQFDSSDIQTMRVREVLVGYPHWQEDNRARILTIFEVTLKDYVTASGVRVADTGKLQYLEFILNTEGKIVAYDVR